MIYMRGEEKKNLYDLGMFMNGKLLLREIMKKNNGKEENIDEEGRIKEDYKEED